MSENNKRQADSELGNMIKSNMIKKDLWFKKLALLTGISRATLNRYCKQGEQPPEPKLKHIQILISTFELGPEDSEKFLDAAYPGWSVWKTAINDKCNLMQTNERLYEKGLPPLSANKNNE